MKYDREGEPLSQESVREKRILELTEAEEIQADNSLDKYIPEKRGSGKQTLTRMDLPSSQTMSGFMDAVKTGMPNISTGDLQKAKNAYQTVKKVYDQNDGNVGKTMSALALNYVPELKMLQSIGENIPYFGIDSEEKYQDLKKRMSGQPTALGGGGEAFFKSVGQLLLNPASTIRLAGDGIEWLGEETYDLFTKNKEADKTKAERALDTGGNQARNLSQQRMKQYDIEKQLADTKGIEYNRNDTTTTSTTSLKKPQTSDFQVSLGSDTTVLDTSAYNEATKKYNEDKRRTLRTKGSTIDSTDFRLRDDLAQYVDSILESHRDGVKSGTSSMSDDELSELIVLSSTLKNKEIPLTYQNLSQIKGDVDLNTDDSILNSDKVQVKAGAFNLLSDTMLKGQGINEADLRVSESQEYKKAVDEKAAIQERKIDDFNQEVIQSRTELTSSGYVNTDNHDRAELRPRIVYGDTDSQILPTNEENRESDDVVDKMGMWKQLQTEDNRLNNILFKRQEDVRKMRYSKTFATPKTSATTAVKSRESYRKRGLGYNIKVSEIPESFIRLSERQFIPVYCPLSESQPLMRDIDRAQKPFSNVEPATDFSLNQRLTQEKMPNRFPENVLRGYKGASLRTTNKFNPWKNQKYIS
jgi:hypothetical protein